MAIDDARHEASLLTQVLRSAPVPLWVIDAHGLVSLTSRAAQGFLGYSGGDDLKGGSSHALLHRHRPDGSPYPAHDCPIMCSTRAQSGVESFVTRAGDVRAVQWSTQRVDSSGARLLSFSALDPAEARFVRSTERLRYPQLPEAQSHAHLREGLLRTIEGRFTDPTFSTADLADEARLSVRSVQAIFAEIGASPAAEIRRMRLDHARTLLEHGHPVQSACHASGFLDPGTFARTYRRRFGLPPSQSRADRANH